MRLIVLWILLKFASSQTPEFTQQPVSMNYNKGEEFIFTCSATNVNALIFFVDGVAVNTGDGFTESETNTNGDLSTKCLTGTAQIQHNNTNISCVGFVIGGDDVFSDVAVLLVQGPLSSVGDLSYSSINSSTVNITWSPPFTLPGTNIIGYNISVATSNDSSVEAFTSNNYIEITVSACDETDITVTGYNGLDGESSTILIDMCSIESITLTDTIGPVIVVVCTFRPNTAAVGCSIQLLTDNIVQYTNTSNRTDDQAIIILSGIITGRYQLRVFEVENDQSLVPVSHLEEELTIVESATITTLIMSSTTLSISPTATSTVSPSNTSITVTSSSGVNQTSTSSTVIIMTSKGINPGVIIGAVVGALVALVIIIIILVIGILVCYIIYNRNRTNRKTTDTGAVNYYSSGIEQGIAEKKNVDQDGQIQEDHKESSTLITDNRISFDGAITTDNDDTNTDTVTANNDDASINTNTGVTNTRPAKNTAVTYEDVSQFKIEHKLNGPFVPEQQISDSELKKILSKKPAEIIYAELGDAPIRCRPRIEVGTSFMYADIKPKLPPKKKNINNELNEDSAL